MNSTQQGYFRIVDALDEEIQKTKETIELSQLELTKLENVRNIMRGDFGITSNSFPAVNGNEVPETGRAKRAYTRKASTKKVKNRSRRNSKRPKEFDWLNPAVEILQEKQQFLPAGDLVDIILTRKPNYKRKIRSLNKTIPDYKNKVVNNFVRNSTGVRSKMMLFDTEGEYSKHLGLTEWKENKENYLVR